MPGPVQLIVTPFLPREQPALGVSSLAAVLASRGIGAQVRYLNLDYLRICPTPLYDIVAHAFSPTLFGEMIFGRALWGDAAPPWSDYFEVLERSRCDRQRGVHASVSLFPDEHTEALFWKEAPGLIQPFYERSPDIVAAWAEEILSSDPKVVGFSTTFQQNVASLALARELRRRAGQNGPAILFGGANCEGSMGRALARNFSFADHIVSGEAERVVEWLVPRLVNSGGMPQPFQMALDRVIPGEPVEDLNLLPTPDFDGYFAAYRKNAFTWPYQLSAETSRGCWWGAKVHCKFCGLNGSSMAYRSKSADRAVTEIKDLSERYATRRLMMADNILDAKYLSSVIPRLRGSGLELFYEVKSNLTKSGLAAMRAAGVTWIQPGIESLSDRTLQLMGKGTTAMQNIQLLRWCFELGVKPSWNILYGFPGEDPGDFDRMAQVAPDLFHLTAPSVVLQFRMDRFSPYFNDPPQYGLTNVRPYWSYQFAYPGLSEKDLADIAYFFEFDYADGRDPRQEAQPLVQAACTWHNAQKRGARLVAFGNSSDGGCVYDARNGRPETVTLTSADWRLLEATDSAIGVGRLLAAQPDLADPLATFRQRRWVYEANARVVRLVAIPDREANHAN
jgi:ribosomal peptide maturation radical SAM protein 1